MTLITKIKWTAGILLVFVLILATNLMDRRNFERINNSVDAIFEDRLLAKNVLFDMAYLIKEKELALAHKDSSFFTQRNKVVNTALDTLITDYEDTYVTNREARKFGYLTEDLDKMQKLEPKNGRLSEEKIAVLSKKLKELNGHLQELSKIQIKEGKKQVMLSQRAMDSMDLFTRLEIYFLIFLALVIQIIVLYQPKKKSKS